MFSRRLPFRLLYGIALLLIIATAIGISALLKTKALVFKSAPTTPITETAEIQPFPVSVDSIAETIEEDPLVDQFFVDTLANDPSSKDNWWNQVASVFASKHWFQNLASPVSRIVVIWPGERKEEVTKHIGDILGWDATERTEFQQLVDTTDPVLAEGKYFPGQYVAHRGATPADVYALLSQSFTTEVISRYTPEVEAKVPFDDALIIASLLEREASDFENMREISGVIWNRLFTNMPLQLDATLQYVKGSNPRTTSWWPVVRPADKFLASPYNTYKNSGLPPAPIANPSAEAILAALNPIVTDCLYYFHTKNKAYHCSATYEEHVSKLRAIYGRGS